jgi:hypothetical protein
VPLAISRIRTKRDPQEIIRKGGSVYMVFGKAIYV